MKKCVIFDRDGVLMDSEIIRLAVNCRQLLRLGLHYSLEKYQSRFVGLSESAYLDELQADYCSRCNENFPESILASVNQERWNLQKSWSSCDRRVLRNNVFWQT